MSVNEEGPHRQPAAPPFDFAVASVTRPDKLALTSWLNHGPLPAAEPFRVLQLGCGAGANLLAMAFFRPDSTFVGLDPSTGAVASAAQTRDELGLTNLRFDIAAWADIPQADAVGGGFDYVLAPDLLAWVGPESRAAVLAACRRLLRPNGVAFVDFVVPDGWCMRETLRRRLGPTLEGLSDPMARFERAQLAARGLSELLQQLSESPYHVLLAEELTHLANCSPRQLEKIYLSDIAFLTASQIAGLISSHGLRWVCEADLNQEDPHHRGRIELREQLLAAGYAAPELEELVDTLTQRRFRTAILCRDDAPSFAPPKPSAIAALYVASDLAAKSERPSLTPGHSMQFEGPAGMNLETDSPVLNASLLQLKAEYPRGGQVAAVFERAVVWLKDNGLEVELKDGQRDEFCLQLLTLHRRGAIELRLWEPVWPAESSWRPHRLARLETQRAGIATTPYHTILPFDAFATAAVAALSDTESTEAAVGVLLREIAAGKLTFSEHGVPILDPQRREALVRQSLAVTMTQLQRWGLLAAR